MEYQILKTNTDDIFEEFDLKGTPVKVVEVGSTGTDIQSGYLFEEYLNDLQGTRAADTFDKMRRSDPKVKMILSAMKNPIKSATWEVNQIGEETREGEIQKAFIEKILFDGLNKTWKSFLHEALSMIDFGYSLFEVTYSAVLNDEVFGSYNGIRSLAFRSQRTIERWDINRHGELECVEQQAFGDHQKVTRIPAKYLLHFALEKEGDNFEGISILRPAYGPWLRKNTFLKLIAAGIEKYAIPIPILKVPEGKQGSKEYKKALESMRKYVSHQCNYLTVPFGWEIELKNNPFDASKIRDVIDAENVEIVNAALANFLELGQSGSGSYALSFDLSDFFLGGLEYVAEQICETLNQQLIPALINLNFADQKPLVQLECSGISDRAGEEFSKIVLNLVNSGTLSPDDRLEDNLRKRFGLPERDETTTRSPLKTPTIQDERKVGGDDEVKTLAEKKDSKKKSNDPVKGKIESGAKKIESIMQKNLNSIADDVAGQASKHWAKKSETTRVAPPKKYDIKAKVEAYRKELREELARQYNQGLSQVRSQYPRFQNIKLSETERRFKLSEIDKINTKGKLRIAGIVDSLVNINVDEIEQTANLQYTQSAEAVENAQQLENQIKTQTKKKISGPMTVTGAIINASTMLNNARKDFFGEMIKTKEVVSFTWVNPDPVTDICKGLSGVTMKADDPDVNKFWPPLHHNCKTYVVANTSTTTDNPEPQNGFVPTETQKKSITLADNGLDRSLTRPDISATIKPDGETL